MAKWFPGRRLSWFRLGALVVVCAGLVAGSMFAWGTWQDNRAAAAMKPWVGGYVDVTAVPYYPFEQLDRGDGRNLVLAFIVGDPDEACTPSWGGAYSLAEAGSALDLDRRLARFRVLGGKAMVSFGGQANQDLAVECTDREALLQGYSSVVERYRLAEIDMDVEGDLLRNEAALTRQAEAVAALQQARPEDRPLDVWLTLPVATDGLDGAGARALDVYLEAGVKLAGVNAMTMDYNDGTDASTTSRIRSSLSGVQAQLRAAYDRRDVSLGNATAWAMVAATPMLGQNDVRGEVFTLEDAAALSRFANKQGMSRISFWSANRDRACDANWPDPRQVSDSCSGVAQEDGAFLAVLRKGRTGSIAQPPVKVPNPDSEQEVVDDPATSPYPIWVEGASYPAGTKVVWRRNVYEAKWWTEAEQPDAPGFDQTSFPWRLVGPVLEGEKPIERPMLPVGTFPEWDPTATYTRGDTVMVGEQAFEAKWWSRGDSPEAALVRPQDSPWRLFNDTEVEKELARLKAEKSKRATEKPKSSAE